MSTVRIRTNFIVNGKFHVRGSLLDLELIPPHLRDSDHIDLDLENRGGKVMILHDLSFMSSPREGSDGVPTSFPTWLRAGSLVELDTLPAVCRENLQEGRDFKSAWVDGEPEQVQKAAEAADLKQLEAEPVLPDFNRRFGR
jgi:hypothetical protein